ncbi:FAD-containing oxidoreductase [Algoriphagus jejuensis]|uniref:FAD-containing oxidoreductase n=1 Tax=Algoriphagus jejuensis TaxID=419934 RepID=A0ABN1N4C2_9BACT
MKKFDAIIIGSGQAGTPLAFRLAKVGMKVALIEKEHLGGTCVNDGCTPTKAYVASARRMWDAMHGAELGVSIPAGAKADLKKIKTRKDSLVKTSVDGIKQGIQESEKLTLLEGEAKFIDQKTLEVNGDKLTAELIYINVGARPASPEIFADVHHLTNKSILKLETVPTHLIIIGASYIGLEFGQMFRRFGSKVTIIEQGDHIIHKEDEEVSNAIREFLAEEGVKFKMNSKVTQAKNTKGGIQLTLETNGKASKVSGSHLLLAVGRKPNSDLLNLEKTGLKPDKKGFIPVDDYLETSVKGIFALGDCNGKGAFTHTAYNDYEIIAQNSFDGKDRKVSDRITTYGLYIDPPLGRAGLTIREAKEKGYKVKIAHKPMDEIARAKEKGETKGFMSVLIDADTDKILGASILGVGGDEIISGILNVMYSQQPYTVIRDSVVPHPTVAELIPTMLGDLK